MNSTDDEPLAPLPPLRIHHFLVWMAVVATVFSLNRIANSSGAGYLLEESSGAESISLFDPGNSMTLIHALMQTLCVTCLAYGIYWRRMGLRFPSQPGHGLLFPQCIGFVSVVTTYVLVALFIELDESGSSLKLEDVPKIVIWYFFWNSNVWSILQSLLIIGCAIRLAEDLRWKIFFGWLGVYILPTVLLSFWLFRDISSVPLEVANSYSLWNGIVYTILAIVTGAMLLAVMRLDWREGKHFHWSHWCGVGGFLIVLVAQIATVGWGYYKYYIYWSTISP